METRTNRDLAAPAVARRPADRSVKDTGVAGCWLDRGEDPIEADRTAFERPGISVPAFLRDDAAADARENEARFAPNWTRDPVDWRDDFDLCARGQLRGTAPPGAALDDNPCALQLELKEDGPAATRFTDKASARQGWTFRGWAVLPLGDGAGFVVRRAAETRSAGQVLVTPSRIEMRRNDAWRTLLTWIAREPREPALETENEQARVAAAAALTFAAPWPIGPPRVRYSAEQE